MTIHIMSLCDLMYRRLFGVTDEIMDMPRSLEMIEMYLEGGWIGTITNFNYYLAILGNNVEYEGKPNNCKCEAKS